MSIGLNKKKEKGSVSTFVLLHCRPSVWIIVTVKTFIQQNLEKTRKKKMDFIFFIFIQSYIYIIQIINNSVKSVFKD